MSDRGNLYIHVYTSIRPGTVFYDSPQMRTKAGEGLVDFLYKELPDGTGCGDGLAGLERLRELHPYFSHISESALKIFLDNSADPSYEGRDSLRGIARLQETYRHWLEKYAEEGFTPELAALTGDFRLYTQSRFALYDGQPALDHFLLGFEDCLFLEFSEIIRAQILIKVCKNCRRLFLPKKSTIDYCTRICTKDQKTCQDVGYTQTFARSVKNDDLLLAYTRAYKAHYARMAKPRKHAGNLSREDFERWYREAKEKLELARSGQLDAGQYKEWLKK